MARSKLRAAAGAGTVAAFLMVGGLSGPTFSLRVAMLPNVVIFAAKLPSTSLSFGVQI